MYFPKYVLESFLDIRDTESPVQREEKEGSTERAQTNGAFTQR